MRVERRANNPPSGASLCSTPPLFCVLYEEHRGKEVMPMTAIAQYFAQFSWSNKKLIKEGLKRQKGELRIEKDLHNVNCPDCGEKPCRKYAWLFVDIQECEHMIRWLTKELRDTYGE